MVGAPIPLRQPTPLAPWDGTADIPKMDQRLTIASFALLVTLVVAGGASRRASERPVPPPPADDSTAPAPPAARQIGPLPEAINAPPLGTPAIELQETVMSAVESVVSCRSYPASLLLHAAIPARASASAPSQSGSMLSVAKRTVRTRRWRSSQRITVESLAANIESR